MHRVAVFCSTHARWVVLAWVLIAVVGGVVTAGVSSRLSTSFTLPGEPGYEANRAILNAAGGGSQDPELIVVTVPAGDDVTSTAVKAALTRGDKALAASLTVSGRPVPRIVSYATSSDPVLVSVDHRTTFVLVYPPNNGGLDVKPLGEPAARTYDQAAGLASGSTVGVTGIGELTGSGKGGGVGVAAETLIGALGAVIILAFVFGSFIAVVPLITAFVSILTTFLLVGALTIVADVSFFVQFIVALIGLGVAIDYSLLVVTRWREERARGRDNRDAVEAAIQTAGRSVVYSGVTVAVGLLALIVLPVPFLRSIGYGGVLIPLVSVLVSVTLLPALLNTAGPFLDRPRRKTPRDSVSRAWAAWTRLVIRRRWLAATLGGLVLGALLVPAFGLVVGEPSSASLAATGPARQAANRLTAASIPTGVLTPIQILTDTDHATDVIDATNNLPGIRGALQSGTADRRAIIDVLPEQETNAGSGAALIDRIRHATAGMNAQVGGSGAQFQAFNHAVYGSFPLMLALIVVTSFILLTRTFRSILMALKAVALNVLSVGATYGILVLVWQKGHGSETIWGIPATGAITNFVPLMVFAFLFGLSMDYEVFILTRIREEYDTSRNTNTAIVEGLARTGRLVTSAALILALSFFALSQAPDTDLKVLATGLGAGILLDATVVRALLVPALLSLFGRYNWWLPAGVARLLRVSSSPAHAYRPNPPASQSSEPEFPIHHDPERSPV
jgi:RND superfamily putative drug exporter